MAATFNIDAYSDALVVLGTAGIVVPLVRRFGLSPVLGYLGAGAILGPLGLGTFKEQIPALYWLTVVDKNNVSAFAELGIVFLLFLIGLELSFQRLITMRRLVFGLGGLQFLLCTAAIAGIVAFAGGGAAAAIIIGSCLALSSTAIVLELLSNQRRMSTTTGRTSFSILLAQDLAVIPILLFVSMLGGRAGGSVITGLALALANAALAVGVIVIVGRLLLRPLFRLVASTGTSELFVAATLFVIVAGAVVSGLAGPVDGARCLRRRPAAGRDRVPQGDRGHHRAVQGPAARPLLLHRRHEHRLPRAGARAAVARCLRGRADRHQGRNRLRPGARCSACRGRRRSRRPCCWVPAASSRSS